MKEMLTRHLFFCALLFDVQGRVAACFGTSSHNIIIVPLAMCLKLENRLKSRKLIA
jgi:hypothetical protein